MRPAIAQLLRTATFDGDVLTASAANVVVGIDRASPEPVRVRRIDRTQEATANAA